MPDFLTVHGNLLCWNCNYSIAKAIDIQWGRVPSQLTVGDSIRWSSHAGKIISPFTLATGKTTWNCGDPALATVIVLDSNVFDTASRDPQTCPQCGSAIAAAGAFIIENRLLSIRTYSPSQLKSMLGACENPTDVFEVVEESTFVPRPEFFDHPISYLNRHE